MISEKDVNIRIRYIDFTQPKYLILPANKLTGTKRLYTKDVLEKSLQRGGPNTPKINRLYLVYSSEDDPATTRNVDEHIGYVKNLYVDDMGLWGTVKLEQRFTSTDLSKIDKFKLPIYIHAEGEVAKLSDGTSQISNLNIKHVVLSRVSAYPWEVEARWVGDIPEITKSILKTK